MRKLCFALCTVLLLAACGKEDSLEQPGSTPGGGGNPGTPSAGLLSRLVYVAGPDSTVMEYGYDAAKRLVTYRLTSTDPDDNESRRIVRNSAGVMTSFITKSPDLLSNGIDSLVSNVAYNATQSRYTHSLSELTDGTTLYFDSTAFIYDGAGNMVSKASFLRTAQSPYIPYQRYDYTYAGGNVTSEKYYAADPTTGAMTLFLTYNYTYDSKVNPLKMGPEALIVMDNASFYGNNNASKADYLAADPSDNFSLAFTYNYNTADKPVTGSAVQTPGGGLFNLRYYYN